MPVTVSYPGLYIEELPSSAHTITAAPTSITAFVGYAHPFLGTCAERGDWGKAIQIFNFADYERTFGGRFRSTFLDTNLAYAVEQFFLNAGPNANAYVVGLQPRYVDTAGTEPPQPIQGASADLEGIRFTARRLTDSTHRLTITIGNLSRANPADTTQPLDRADIQITYGIHVETYRRVRTRTGTPSTYTDPDPASTTFDKDFIENRLAVSSLVTVSVVPPATEYRAAFTATPPALTLELVDMPPPKNSAGIAWAGWTTFNPNDFLSAFDDDSDLDKVEIFNLLVVPGVTHSAIWNKGLAFCEQNRAFFIMDPPSQYAADFSSPLMPAIEELMATDLVPKSIPNGALYFPYLNVADPVTNQPLALPPSGYVAGIYAKTDTNRGVWKAPAGLETSITNTTGVVKSGKMTDMRQGVLNPLGVNVLRSFPGAGTVVWGARTIVTKNPSFQQWRYVPVRRTALFIEQTLVRNLAWVVFEPNDEPLWSAIRISIDSFMTSLFRQQAFQGKTPNEAFLVKCDKSTTTPEDIGNGIVNIVVGFRPLKPAEFVIIKITQLAGQVQT